jgi:hypothetical protein
MTYVRLPFFISFFICLLRFLLILFITGKILVLFFRVAFVICGDSTYLLVVDSLSFFSILTSLFEDECEDVNSNLKIVLLRYFILLKSRQNLCVGVSLSKLLFEHAENCRNRPFCKANASLQNVTLN